MLEVRQWVRVLEVLRSDMFRDISCIDFKCLNSGKLIFSPRFTERGWFFYAINSESFEPVDFGDDSRALREIAIPFEESLILLSQD